MTSQYLNTYRIMQESPYPRCGPASPNRYAPLTVTNRGPGLPATVYCPPSARNNKPKTGAALKPTEQPAQAPNPPRQKIPVSERAAPTSYSKPRASARRDSPTVSCFNTGERYYSSAQSTHDNLQAYLATKLPEMSNSKYRFTMDYDNGPIPSPGPDTYTFAVHQTPIQPLPGQASAGARANASASASASTSPAIDTTPRSPMRPQRSRPTLSLFPTIPEPAVYTPSTRPTTPASSSRPSSPISIAAARARDAFTDWNTTRRTRKAATAAAKAQRAREALVEARKQQISAPVQGSLHFDSESFGAVHRVLASQQVSSPWDRTPTPVSGKKQRRGSWLLGKLPKLHGKRDDEDEDGLEFACGGGAEFAAMMVQPMLAPAADQPDIGAFALPPPPERFIPPGMALTERRRVSARPVPPGVDLSSLAGHASRRVSSSIYSEWVPAGEKRQTRIMDCDAERLVANYLSMPANPFQARQSVVPEFEYCEAGRGEVSPMSDTFADARDGYLSPLDNLANYQIPAHLWPRPIKEWYL